MLDSVRCKFSVSEVTHTSYGSERVRAHAVYDDGIDQENKSFAEATPAGDLEFEVSNPNAKGYLQPGDHFYVDITKINYAEPES